MAAAAAYAQVTWGMVGLGQAVNPLDAGSLLAAFGALGIAAVLFAETGLLVGFFLPGDSLLFTAGLLCAPGAGGAVHLALPQVLAAAAAGTLAGSQTGYWIGRRGGRGLLARSRARRLHEGAARAEEYLARYGHAKAIVLARFVPVVRTVLNPLAGALNVPVRTFTRWQITGGLVWTLGLTLAGYALGSSVPNVDRYLLPLVALVVLVSLTPLALEVLRSRRSPTPAPTGTDTPAPTGTDTPAPTGTDTPAPTGTDTPAPTGTDTPAPTGTDTPAPTGTDTPASTGTDTPAPTGTDRPAPTGTDRPAPPGR